MSRVSVNDAIRRGLRVMYLSLGAFVLVFFGLFFGLAIYTSVNENAFAIHPGLIFLFSFIAGCIAMYLLWGLLIPKWKIWAYEHVSDIHAFQRKAEQYYLLYQNKRHQNFFELKTTTQKKRLNELEKRFLNIEEAIEREYITDLPDELKVGTMILSKIILAFSSLITIFSGVIVIWFMGNSLWLLFGLGLVYMGGWLLFKRVINPRFKFILNHEGILFLPDEFITWKEINRIDGRLKFMEIEYQNKFGETVIMSFNLKEMNRSYLEIEDYFHSYRNAFLNNMRLKG